MTNIFLFFTLLFTLKSIEACDSGADVTEHCEYVRNVISKINDRAMCSRRHDEESHLMLERLQDLVDEFHKLHRMINRTIADEQLVYVGGNGNHEQGNSHTTRNLTILLQSGKSRLVSTALNLAILENHGCKRMNTNLLHHVMKLICSMSKILDTNWTGSFDQCPSLTINTYTQWWTYTAQFLRDAEIWARNFPHKIKRTVMLRIRRIS